MKLLKVLVWYTMKIHLNPFERVQIVHFIFYSIKDEAIAHIK